MKILDIHRLPSQPLIRHGQQTKTASKQLFTDHLQQALQPETLKISKHAQQRLTERGIEMTETEWARISEKVDEARRKGIRESLVLTEEAALIVSAKNATVITAMNRMEAKDQLFTNIDATILLS